MSSENRKDEIPSDGATANAGASGSRADKERLYADRVAAWQPIARLPACLRDHRRHQRGDPDIPAWLDRPTGTALPLNPLLTGTPEPEPSQAGQPSRNGLGVHDLCLDHTADRHWHSSSY